MDQAVAHEGSFVFTLTVVWLPETLLKQKARQLKGSGRGQREREKAHGG